MTCLLICKEESRFDEWQKQTGVQELKTHMKEVRRLPNPTFPQPDTDHAGRHVVRDQALLDIFDGKVADWIRYNPATCGAIHSHRNAWLWGEIHTPTEWLMIIEDDITPRGACVDRLLVVLHAIKKNPGVTQMCMLAGSEAPLMVDRQRQHSTSVHNCARLLDVRTYPAHKTENNFVVPLHVGMGLKWYVLSPAARRVLLRMRVAYRSFERCVWRRIFDEFQGPRRKWQDSNRMTSVLAASPVLASTPESMDSDWGGSGRRTTDAGHSLKPYVMIDPADDWTLGQRLNTLSVVMSVCESLDWGVIMVWQRTERVPIAYEDLCGVHSEAERTNTFVHVLQDKRGGAYIHFRRHGDIRIHVQQPMMCLPTLDRLLDLMATLKPRPAALPNVDWESARWIQIKRKWIDNVHKELPGADLPPWHEWPDSLHALVLCDEEDLSEFNLHGKCHYLRDKWINSRRKNQHLNVIDELLETLELELEDILGQDSTSRIILIRMTHKTLGKLWVDMINKLEHKFGKRIITPDFLTRKMIPKGHYDDRNSTNDWLAWGESLAKTVGLLTIIPPKNLHYGVMSWIVGWNHIMSKGKDHPSHTIPEIMCTFYQSNKDRQYDVLLKNGPACQTNDTIERSRILQAIANDTRRGSDKKYNLLSYSKWFAEKALRHLIDYANSPLSIVDNYVSRACQRVFEQIPPDDVGHAEAQLRQHLQKRESRKERVQADSLDDVVKNIKTIDIAREKWIGEAAQSWTDWSWGKTFIMLVLNQWRQDQNMTP